MKRYLIEEAKCGATAGGVACGLVGGNAVVTVKYKDGEESKWLSLIEAEGFPNFYTSNEDIFDKMLNIEYLDGEAIEEFQDKYTAGPANGFNFGTDYYEVFDHITEEPDDPAIPLVKLLLTLINCYKDEEKNIIESAVGKFADELSFSFDDMASWRDDYDDEDDDYMADFIQNLPEDNEHLFPLWMALEADVNTDSVWHDLDSDIYEEAKEELKVLKVMYGGREKEYDAWKRDYLEKEFEKLKDKDFLTCSYVFLGMGSYTTTIPAEEKEGFMKWIEGNGSALPTGEHKATKEEIENYIALRATERL